MDEDRLFAQAHRKNLGLPAHAGAYPLRAFRACRFLCPGRVEEVTSRPLSSRVVGGLFRSCRGRWAVCFRRLWSAARGQPGGLGGTALRRADAARPARGRVRRRAVPAMLRWVLHPLGDGRRRSQLQLLQLRRRGDSLAPMTAAASAAAPRALRARVCRVADSSPRPSTTSFFVRQIPSRFSTCWRIFLARRMPSSPRRCARHPPRR